MPCYHPIEVGIARKGLYGKGTFFDQQIVPCGSCIGCRAEQSRQWAVRMMHEARMHKENVFVTLTIDDRHMNENAELCARDFSGFIKNLRQREVRQAGKEKRWPRKISFFGCGEYGERSERPHYHALLFNIGFLDRDLGFDSGRPNVWRSKSLEDTWGRGICEGGTVTMASASYVAGYMKKRMKASRQVRCDRITGEMKAPEFARMSLRPPIGKRWIEKYWPDVYPADFVIVDGVKCKPPKYYDRWMQFLDEQGGSNERRMIFEDVKNKRYEQDEMTPYQVRAAEKIHVSRDKLFAGRHGV